MTSFLDGGFIDACFVFSLKLVFFKRFAARNKPSCRSQSSSLRNPPLATLHVAALNIYSHAAAAPALANVCDVLPVLPLLSCVAVLHPIYLVLCSCIQVLMRRSRVNLYDIMCVKPYAELCSSRVLLAQSLVCRVLLALESAFPECCSLLIYGFICCACSRVRACST